MMRNNKIALCFLMIGAILFLVMGAYAAVPSSYSGQNSFAKSAQDRTTRTLSNINNWSYWQYSDGTSGIDPSGNSGGIYPRGTAGVVFQDGLVWGAIVNQKIQVGGATYNTGTQPGWIENGTAVDPNNARAQIYKIRADWATLTPPQVTQEAAELLIKQIGDVTEAEAQAIIDRYAEDWKNWPVDLGAPYYDVNNNGVYDPILDADGYPTTDGDHPGVASADQVLWFVINDQDPAKVAFLYGSDPMGVELQTTVWGYNQPGARLGQIIFKKYLFMNKSSNVFDSMYVAQWCDPDVGNSTDDLVGCDSLLGVGFSYNSSPSDGTFDPFNIPPPALGYDFFQGPLLVGQAGEDLNNNGIDDAEDYGIRNLKEVGPGLINLPMTSFGYFSAGNAEWEDPELQIYQGTLEWYNLLRGFITTDDVLNPTPFYHRGTGNVTKWPLNGDPVAGTGDIDGQGANFAATDRRMALCSGPFEMQPGDSQEVVVAMLGGTSDDATRPHLLAVNDLKLTDDVAQKVFDDLFEGIPKAPAGPQLKAYADETGIVLNWGFNQAAVKATEETVTAGYAFEGYNVYQLPTQTASKAQAVKLATFDLKNGVMDILGTVFSSQYGATIEVPLQNGKDTGIQRYLELTQNAFTGEPFYPGNTYYFAVTAYNYNENPQLIEDKALESPLTGFPVTTQSPPPGVRYESEVKSDIPVEQIAGSSDGQVVVQVVDPSAVTGDQYRLFFTENQDSTIAPVGEILWGVVNVTKGDTVVKNQPQNASINEERGPIIDGLLVKVAGPPDDFKSFQVVANAAGPVDPPDIGCFAFNANGFPFLFNDRYPDGADRPTSGVQQTNGSTWGVHTGMTGANDGTYAYFLTRVARNDNFDRIVPYDFEMRFNSTGSLAAWAFESDWFSMVPFELWNIGINTPDDPSDDYKMIPWTLNDVGDAGATPPDTTYNINPTDHAVSGGDNDPYMDWVYWRNPIDLSPGTAGYDQYVSDAKAGTYDYGSPEVMARTVLVNWNGGSVSDATFPANLDAVIPEEGTIVQIVSTKPNRTTDVFSFTSTNVITDEALAKEDVVDKITVYPNPYYATNPQEPDRFTKFITFYHLPPRQSTPGNPFGTETIIRIFDLGGALVRTLEKTDNSQFLRWDLRNESNLPVASGIYIAYIEMPQLGAEKVLKIFIVQPEQIIRYY